MYTRSNSNANNTNVPKQKTDAYNANSQHINDHANHLFHFVQVSIDLKKLQNIHCSICKTSSIKFCGYFVNN